MIFIHCMQPCLPCSLEEHSFIDIHSLHAALPPMQPCLPCSLASHAAYSQAAHWVHTLSGKVPKPTNCHGACVCRVTDGSPCSLHGHSSWSFIAETFDASRSFIDASPSKPIAYQVSKGSVLSEQRVPFHVLFDQVSKIFGSFIEE